MWRATKRRTKLFCFRKSLPHIHWRLLSSIQTKINDCYTLHSKNCYWNWSKGTATSHHAAFSLPELLHWCPFAPQDPALALRKLFSLLGSGLSETIHLSAQKYQFGVFSFYMGENGQTGLSVKWTFLIAEEANLAIGGFQFRQQKMEHVQRRKILSATCIVRNRRKIIILSASDPWKYSVRAKKNHETDLKKHKAFQKWYIWALFVWLLVSEPLGSSFRLFSFKTHNGQKCIYLVDGCVSFSFGLWISTHWELVSKNETRSGRLLIKSWELVKLLVSSRENWGCVVPLGLVWCDRWRCHSDAMDLQERAD